MKWFLNAKLTIISTYGIVIFVSDEHPEKAPQPIEVTLFGIVIFISDEHPEKAKSLILVKPFGMIMDLISCSINVLMFNILIDFGSSIPFNVVSQI